MEASAFETKKDMMRKDVTMNLLNMEVIDDLFYGLESSVIFLEENTQFLRRGFDKIGLEFEQVFEDVSLKPCRMDKCMDYVHSLDRWRH